MAEKDIILRINAVTNQDVVEAYGETIDEALGTYEKWIKTTKDATAVIEGYNKKIKEGNTLTTEEIKSLNEEKAKRSEAQRLMRQEDKIRTSANGSLKQQQLLLSKVNDALRKLTDEQKKAHPELVKFQKALYDQVKGVNAEMGNFQMNVGNYPQLLQQILPVQGQMSNGLMQIAQNAGATTGALGALGVGLGAAVGAYKLFQKAQELTQTLGDAVAIKMAGWESVWSKFIRTIVSADFSNFLQGLRDAKDVGEEVAATLDELFERNNALTIAESKASVVQQRNLMIMRDQTKSIKERKEAGEAYMASVMELANVRKDIAEQEFGAKLTNFAAQTGLSEEDAKFYIANYNKYREIANKYAEEEKKAVAFADARREALREKDQAAADKADAQRKAQVEANKQMFASMSDDEQRFITISSKYNNANDELTADLVQAWAKVEGSIANALQSSQRAATTVNSLTAQQNKQELKAVDFDPAAIEAAADAEQAKVEKMLEKSFSETSLAKQSEYFRSTRADARRLVDEAMSYFDDLLEEMETTDFTLATAKMPEKKKSPLAKMLNISDEELTSLKAQAEQAAQQIFSSIQQIAQDATQRRLENELKAVEDEAESEKAILKGKLDKNLITEKQYEKKLAEIDADAEAKREELNKEAFEKQKRWNIAQALMNGALALTKLFTEATVINPATWIAAGITTATTAAQIAAIGAQKYARGGELHGASHAQGGIKGNVQGHNIELEGEEVVINKRSARKYRNALSWINSDNGWGVDFAGVRGSGGYTPQLKFARGGVLGSFDFSPSATPTSSSVQQAMVKQANRFEEVISAINRRIDRLQVQVNISDIDSAHDTKQVHISRAAL
ncbi:MAG: hypothetical protein II282_06135 [Alistipes sp.]|nr:hypothetical protein [Alistipes sp.]